MPNASAIDLFCGAGGLAFGMKQAGINIAAGIDIDPACKFPFESNVKAKYIDSPVEAISGLSLKKMFSKNEIKILAGCAPCQPFSKYSYRYEIEKEKWRLLYEFLRIAKEMSPAVITMENVAQLEKHKVFNDFCAELKKMRYTVSFSIADCVSFGIPQTRKRLVLFATKYDSPIELISPSQMPPGINSVREAIGDLPPIAAGESSKTDSLHRSCSLSEKNLKRIKASKPGGTWRDWSKNLRADCHNKESGQTYPAVYGRMKWDEPSPTITTQCFGFGNGRFGHPIQDRAISLREASILQSFPRDYVFVDQNQKTTFNKVGRMIGNAVPVRLGLAIGLSILHHLKENP
ncbi:MAG: DNA cytosine methyltransferase [Chryseobacterium sp.]|nr:MAG: DNA cytosine methyltransferase [Chryseobacterium sp.]